MEISYGITDVHEKRLDLTFWDWTCFNFFKQGSIIGIFEYHVSDFLFFVDLIIEELYNFRMGQLIMKDDFVFGEFIDLKIRFVFTILTATISPESIFFANLTWP